MVEQNIASSVKFDDLNFVFDKILDGPDNNTTIIEIFKYMYHYHKAKSIIIENKYIDRDYRNELGNFYSKTFQEKSGYSRRIHFFKDQFTGMADFITKLSSDDKLDYLGYFIRRPLNVGKVGRTLIKPYSFDNFHYLCVIEREVHLMGKTLIVKGTPFIEQDAMVITCAQSSMWMVSKYMHYVHDLPRHLPFEITQKTGGAFGYLGKSVTQSKGLNFRSNDIWI